MGISLDRVESEVAEWMTCFICSELLEKTMVLSCGHYFCRECIINVKIGEKNLCPECSTQINLEKWSEASLFMKSDGYFNITQ